jgi:hypothetical protein
MGCTYCLALKDPYRTRIESSGKAKQVSNHVFCVFAMDIASAMDS